jgi:hypothetical protein
VQHHIGALSVLAQVASWTIRSESLFVAAAGNIALPYLNASISRVTRAQARCENRAAKLDFNSGGSRNVDLVAEA